MLSHIINNGHDYDLFEQIEGEIIGLMAEYGGEYLFRLKHHDGSGESHLVTFPSEEAFTQFRNDPRRTELRERMGEHISSVHLTRCTIL